MTGWCPCLLSIRKGYDTMRHGREFHLTDPNGTDLRWSLDEQMWDRYNELWGNIINNHSPRWTTRKSAPSLRNTEIRTSC